MLQLAENLRKSMILTSAEIWTGKDGHYELVAGVPHRQPAPIAIGAKERAVVARAGVSGGTWLDIWVPQLVGADRQRVDARRAGRPRRAAARPHRRHPAARRRAVHRERGHGPHRARPPGRPGAAQRAARHRAAGEPRRAAASATTSCRSRGPASSPPATPSAASSSATCTTAPSSTSWRWPSSCAWPMTRSRTTPTTRSAMIDEIKADVQDAIARAAGAGPRHLPAAARVGRPGRGAAGGRRRAARCRRPSSSTGVGRYGNEIEAAVYFCVLEALQNAGKHAGERRDHGARVVADDGTPAVRGVRRRRRVRAHRAAAQRPRLRQHGRPAGRLRRHARKSTSAPGAGTHDQGTVPRLDVETRSFDQAGSPPASQRRRIIFGDSSSLLT